MKPTIFDPLHEMRNILLRALRKIENHTTSADKKTHAIRVMSKKLRSLLYLIKPSLQDKESVKIQKRFYKELSKDFSIEREMKVMHDTFLMLIKRNKLHIDGFDELIAAIKENKNNSSGPNIDEKLLSAKSSIQKAIDELDIFRRSDSKIKKWKKGFKKTYKKAYESLHLSLQSHNIEDIHTFRKYAKYHMYQAISLKYHLKYSSKKIKALEKLTWLLGKCNDIELFGDFLHKNTDIANSTQMITYAAKEQKKLTKKALKMASKIFNDPKKIKKIL